MDGRRKASPRWRGVKACGGVATTGVSFGSECSPLHMDELANRHAHADKHTETSRRPLPDAASVYGLLGKLWYSYGFLDQAIECWVEAVKLNPFMWDAFLGICNSGERGVTRLNVTRIANGCRRPCSNGQHLQGDAGVARDLHDVIVVVGCSGSHGGSTEWADAIRRNDGASTVTAS